MITEAVTGNINGLDRELDWEEAKISGFKQDGQLNIVTPEELAVAPPPEDGSELEDATFDPNKLGLSFKRIYYPAQPEEWDAYQ